MSALQFVGGPAPIYSPAHAHPDHRPGRPRHPVSHVAPARRVRRDERRAGLLGRVRGAADRRCDGIEGHGLTFTTGRGNGSLRRGGAGAGAARRRADAGVDHGEHGAVLARVTGDAQLRWIGPEKGAIHLATAAIVNAVWDLWAKAEGKPVWKLLADMTPEAARGLRRLSVHHRRDHAGRGGGAAGGAGSDQVRARGGDAARRVSGVHDVGRVARVSGRQAPPALPRGGGGGVHAPQDQGRPRPRGRPAALRDHPRGDRPRPAG